MNLYFMAMVLDDLVFYELVLYDLVAPLVLIYAPVGEKQVYLVTYWKLKKFWFQSHVQYLFIPLKNHENFY